MACNFVDWPIRAAIAGVPAPGSLELASALGVVASTISIVFGFTRFARRHPATGA